MRPRLPIFTAALVLVAWRPALAQQNPPATGKLLPAPVAVKGPFTSLAATPGETLLKSAVAELARMQTVAAKMRQQVNLFGHQIIGSGTYLQQGRGVDLRLRMELKLRVAERLSSLQQVSDGKSFWVRSDGLDETRITRVDLARVRYALQRQQLDAPANVTAGISVGGLPRLLENLDASFRFGAATEERLDRLVVWKIEGEWERTKLADLLPAQAERLRAGNAPDFSKLPEHLPDRVRLMLGKDDLFPYRFEFLRMSPEINEATGRREAKVLVLMEFFEVQTNVAIDARNFVYQPTKFEDATGTFLRTLGLSEQAATAKAEAKVSR